MINAPFLAPEVPEPLPELAIWEEPWVWDLAKQLGGVILVLILILFVLRPTMKRLSAPPVIERITTEGAAEGAEGAAGAAGTQGKDAGSLAGPGEQMQLPGPEQYEDTLNAAREMVQEDPKRVAQVVKSWVAEDAG